MNLVFSMRRLATAIVAVVAVLGGGIRVAAAETRTLNALFIGNSLTLRFVNDGHLNQTMAYLTACTFQAALFGRSPEGLPVDTVTDTRFIDAAHKDRDRDGKPIRRTFSAKERLDLQRIAWEGFQEFRQISPSADAMKPTKAPAAPR